MSEVQRDVNRYFDIKHLVISNLLKDKRLLNNIFKRVGKQEFKFSVTLVLYLVLYWCNPDALLDCHTRKISLMLPLFGGFVGF